VHPGFEPHGNHCCSLFASTNVYRPLQQQLEAAAAAAAEHE
jgi:hypothetical protein